MRKRLLNLSILTMALIFSAALFTGTANAYDDDDSDRRHRNHYRHGDDSDYKHRKHFGQSRHVRPDYRNSRGNRFEHQRWDRGNKHGHYKKHVKRDYKHYRNNRYDRYDHRRHSNHRYKKDDPQFIFSLVLPLISSFDSRYDGY